MDKTRSSERFLNGFKTVENKFRSFLYTDWYLILVCVLVYAAWAVKSAPFGFSAVIIIACIVLVLSDDVLPLTVNIFTAAMMIYSSSLNDYLYLWPFFIPLGIAIVVFIVRNFKNKIVIGKMFFPQLAVSVALLLGGVGVCSGEEYVRALPTVLFLGIGVLAVYVLYCTFSKQDENRDVALYFSRVMMYVGLLVSVELITAIIRADVPMSEWNTAYWLIGWGNRNNVATMLVITAPLCFYLSTRYKQGWIYVGLGLFQYACLIMTFSRGGVLFGFIGALFAAAFAIVKAPNKKRQLITFGCYVGVVLIFYLIFMRNVNDMFSSLIRRGTELSGRDELYAEAWQLYKAHPFLGVGMGYVGTGPSPYNDMSMYWFHSTLFQVLACTGTVGLLLYIYYYAVRLGIHFKNIKNGFNLFMLAVFIGFEGYSMMDTGTIVPYPNMMLIIVSMYVLERTQSGKFDGLADDYNNKPFRLNFKTQKQEDQTQSQESEQQIEQGQVEQPREQQIQQEQVEQQSQANQQMQDNQD